MGLISNALSVLPQAKEAISAHIPTWEAGMPQQIKDLGYERSARQGYMLDEVVYACVEVRATSASEPKICAYKTRDAKEKVEKHPALTLLERPNPFLDGPTFWEILMMYLDVAGNAYVEKVRSRAGKVVELWLMRPDRVRIIPDRQRFIGGYSYTVGDHTFPPIPPEDIIHFKTRHPLDDYYGLSPMHVLANRVDLDVWSRQFTQAFFRNAGVPAGMLNIKRALSAQDRALLKEQWQQNYSGPEGWHKLLVIDDGEAEYQPMGLPLGPRGTAVAELDEINEARICMVYQVPPSLIATRIGMDSSSYANRVSDRQLFWDSTLTPIYRKNASTLTRGLQADFPDLDRFEFDMTDVRALQEDEDKKHTRYLHDFQGGLISRIEARTELGFPPEPAEPSVYLIPIRTIETPTDEVVTVAEGAPALGLPADAAALRPGATPPASGEPNVQQPATGQNPTVPAGGSQQ